MKDVLRVTGVLGIRQGVGILAAIAAAKAWAVLVGAPGVALSSLLTSLLGVAGLIAGLGIPAALVHYGSASLGAQEPALAARYRSAALRILAASGGAAALGMVLFRGPLATRLLDDATLGAAVAVAAPAVILHLLANAENGRLVMHRRIDALARSGITASLATAAVGVAFVAAFGVAGIPPALLLTAAVTAGSTAYFSRRALGPGPRHDTATLRPQMKHLVRWGLPVAASQAAGAGVALLLPFLVLQLLDSHSVAYHRVAVALSTSYLALLLEAMAQDYYPRLAGAGRDAGRVRDIVNQQMRLVLFLAAPAALVVLTFDSQLVPLLYTSEFLPAVGVLEWQLVGDMFKLASWCLNMAVMTHLGSGTFFLMELVAGAAMVASTWLGTRWFGLPGVGIGFCAAYVFYFLLTATIVGVRLKILPTAVNIATLALVVGALTTVMALPAVGLPEWRLPVGAALSALAAGSTGFWIVRTFKRER